MKNIYTYSLTFGNYGYMGQPIILALFGDRMLYKFLIFCLPLYVAVYTWGIAILIPSKTRSSRFKFLKDVLKFPFVSMFVGIIFGLLLSTTIGNLGGCMGPVAMVLLGLVIGKYDLIKQITNIRVYIVTILRLFVIPAVLLLILWLLKADNTALITCLFAFGTPMGLNTIIYPSAIGADASVGASMATISHTFSIVSLPIMYLLFTIIFT